MAPNFKTHPGLVKWWKSYVYTTGQRIQVQSPYRKDHITPFLKHIPESAKKKITENFWDVVPPFAFLFGIMTWADWANDQEHRKHRS